MKVVFVPMRESRAPKGARARSLFDRSPEAFESADASVCPVPADKPSPFFYIFSMPRYDFNIRQGEKANSRGQQLDFPDDRSAWREAALLCRDYSRDIVSEFETHPE
jgi:hypothetical protein